MWHISPLTGRLLSLVVLILTHNEKSNISIEAGWWLNPAFYVFKMSCFYPSSKPIAQRTFSTRCFPELFGLNRPQLSGIWRRGGGTWIKRKRKGLEVRDNQREKERETEGNTRRGWMELQARRRTRERRRRFSRREGEIEVEVEGWVGKKHNELTVPS